MIFFIKNLVFLKKFINFFLVCLKILLIFFQGHRKLFRDSDVAGYPAKMETNHAHPLHRERAAQGGCGKFQRKENQKRLFV